MAGDWLKMRTNLRRHPKVVRMASALNADRLRIVGGLHAVWSVFDEHSEDGILVGYSSESMDIEIGCQGFCAAMIAVEWLADTGQSLEIPRADAHNGTSAKRRAQETERKRDARTVPKMSASDADKLRSREEKRREEHKEQEQKKEHAPQAAFPTPTKRTDLGHRIPDDWTLTPDLEAYCRQKRPDLDPHDQAERFVLHWRSKAGKDARKTDWGLTYMTWIRNAHRTGGTYATSTPSRNLSAVERVKAANDRAEQRQRDALDAEHRVVG